MICALIIRVVCYYQIIAVLQWIHDMLEQKIKSILKTTQRTKLCNGFRKLR